jgi:hypothetical protein
VKKLIIAIVLIAVVVGSVFGGLALAVAGPALKAVGTTSPGDISVTGTGWTPGVLVDLYMDTQDANHHVGVATPDARGGFSTKFSLQGALLGNHMVIGVQGLVQGLGLPPHVDAPFTLKSSSPVDDRTYTEVANIEAKLDNPDTGLAEIKREVRDIEMMGGELVALAANTVQISTAGDCPTVTGSWQTLHQDTDTTIKHVHLTVARKTNNFDLNIKVRVGTAGDLDEFDLVAATNVTPGVYTYEFDAAGWKLRAKSASGGDLCYSSTTTYQPRIITSGEPWPDEPAE